VERYYAEHSIGVIWHHVAAVYWDRSWGRGAWWVICCMAAISEFVHIIWT